MAAEAAANRPAFAAAADIDWGQGRPTAAQNWTEVAVDLVAVETGPNPDRPIEIANHPVAEVAALKKESLAAA